MKLKLFGLTLMAVFLAGSAEAATCTFVLSAVGQQGVVDRDNSFDFGCDGNSGFGGFASSLGAFVEGGVREGAAGLNVSLDDTSLARATSAGEER